MSHTMMMLLGGFVMLAVFMVLSRNNMAAGAKRFIPIWLVVSIGNMLVGVLYAGYGWAEEAAVLLFVFGVPAAVAFAATKLVRR